LETSPQHYGAITGKRPDIAPDVIESAQRDAGYTYDQAYDESFARQQGTTTEALVANLDSQRVRTAIGRLNPQDLATVHKGLYDEIGRVSESNHEIADVFAGRLREISGNSAGQFALGNLRGEELTKSINSVLVNSSPSTSLQTIIEEGGRPPSPPPRPAGGGETVSPGGVIIPPTYRPQAPREDTPSSPEGGLDIPHENPPEEPQ